MRQKTFSEIVGVHGFSKDACYTLTVIYDTTNHKLITAFPTIWWKKAKRLERSEESWVHHWRRCFNDRWISIVTKKAKHYWLIDTDLYLFFALLQASTGVHLGKDKTVPLLVACAWQFQRVLISLTFSLTWSIITFLHLDKNEDVLARQLLITKRMLRPFHVTNSYLPSITRTVFYFPWRFEFSGFDCTVDSR